MSDQEIKKILAALKPKAKAVHDAAKIIAADGEPINNDWIKDIGDVIKNWEICTITLEVRINERKYSERLNIKLNDGTVLLSTYNYITDYGSEFEISTFRNGPWADRLINHSKEGVMAEREKQKKEELEKKLKPFSEIDF